MSAFPGRPGRTARGSAPVSDEHRDPESATEHGVDEVSDDWLRDEWWRATNPGASAARGLLWGLGLSALLWLAIIGVGWWAWSLIG